MIAISKANYYELFRKFRLHKRSRAITPAFDENGQLCGFQCHMVSWSWNEVCYSANSPILLQRHTYSDRIDHYADRAFFYDNIPAERRDKL